MTNAVFLNPFLVFYLYSSHGKIFRIFSYILKNPAILKIFLKNSLRKYKTKNLNIFFLLSLLPSCLLFFFFYFIILLNVRVHFCYHCGGERRKKSLPQYGKILATVANSLIPSVCFKREYILRFIKKGSRKKIFLPFVASLVK